MVSWRRMAIIFVPGVHDQPRRCFLTRVEVVQPYNVALVYSYSRSENYFLALSSLAFQIHKHPQIWGYLAKI